MHHGGIFNGGSTFGGGTRHSAPGSGTGLFSGSHRSSGSGFRGGTSSRGPSGSVQHAPQSSFMQHHFSGRHSGYSGHNSGIGQRFSSGNLSQSFRHSSSGNSGLSNSFHHGAGTHHGWNSQQWGSTWRNHLNSWGNRSYFFGFSSPFLNYFSYPRYYGSYGLNFGFGYGYPGYYGYSYGYPGYGYGYGYPGYGYYGSPLFAYQPICSYYAYTPVVTTGVAAQQPVQQTVGATPSPADDQTAEAPSPEALEDGLNFASQGEQAFRDGQYEAAARDWQHAIVDDPMNGAYVLMLGQALFATGKYDQAAGAVQHATRILPEDQWGVIGSNYRELYTHIGDYTKQLRALEKARDDNPDKPALRFLLGWHYGYLGYPKEAVRELDKCLSLAPKDEVAQKIRNIMAAKLKPEDVPAAPAEKAAANNETPAKPAETKNEEKSAPPLPEKTPVLTVPEN